MKKILLMSVMMITFFSFNKAQAGFMIEPHFGINLGSSFEGSNGFADGDISGNQLGAKLGWSVIGGFNFGFNYRQGALEFDPDCSGCNNQDADLEMHSLFIGYDLSVLFRVWGEFILPSSKIKDDGADAVQASGTVLGIGYKLMPLVSLNFELANYTFDEDTNDNDLNVDYSTCVLGVSFPLSI